MKQFLIMLLACCCLKAPAQLAIPPDAVIVYDGDSITEILLYTQYLWTGYLGKYPTIAQHHRMMGKSGQQFGGTYNSPGSPNFKGLTDKWSAPCFPSIFFLMATPNGSTASNVAYSNIECIATNAANGMGAGDYGSLITVKAGTSYTGAQVVLLGTIPGSVGNGPQKDADRSDAHQAIATLYGYPYCNLYRYLQAPISNNQSQLTFIDDTHPGMATSVAMWYAIEDSVGEFNGTNKIISTVTIDSTHGTALAVTNATIGSISTTATGGSFTWLSFRNPAAFDSQPDANGVDPIAGALAVFPGIYTNQPYMLRWSNLVDNTYTLSVDGEAVTNLTTSGGVLVANVTAFKTGPIQRQLTNLLYLTRIECGVIPTNIPGQPGFNNRSPNTGFQQFISNANVQFAAGKTNQALHDALATFETTLRLFDTTNQAAAVPITRTFSLAPASAPPAAMIPAVGFGSATLSGNGNF